MYVAGISELEKAIKELGNKVLIASKNVLTMEEAMIYTDKSESRFRELVTELKIPYYRTYGRFYFKKSDIDNYLTQENFKKQ